MATYYIDGDASGGGDGSLSTPWNDVEDVEGYDTATGFNAGDIIKFKRGTVITGTDARFNMVNGGSAGSPITYTSYYNSDGSDDTSKAKPVLDCGNTDAAGTWTEQTSNGLPGVYLSDYTGSTVGALTEDQIWLKHSSDIEAIGAGEWFFNAATNPNHSQNLSYADGIYYKPSTDTPSDHTVKRVASRYGWLCPDLSYITFENLHFKGGYHGLAVWCGSAASAAVTNVIVNNCEFSELAYPIEFRGRNGQSVTDCRATNNTVHTCAHGIGFESYSLGTEPNERHVISGNSITSINRDGKFSTYNVESGAAFDQESIEIQNADTCVVENNTIANIGEIGGSYGSGIILWLPVASGKMDNNRVEGNKISHVVWKGITLGAGVAASNGGGNRIAGNLITECSLAGIDINTTSANSYVSNNTIVDCLDGIIVQTTCASWAIQSNVIKDSTNNHVNTDGAMTCTFDYNNYYPNGDLYTYSGTQYSFANWKTQTSTDANSTSGTDPLLDSNNRPTSSSPLIGAGTKWWTGANPVGIDGEPFADFETDIGGIQGKHSSFHPSNL